MLSAIKNFGVTFLISLLIFGIVGFFGTNLVSGTVNDIITTEKEKLEEIVENGEDEAITPDSNKEENHHTSKSEIEGSGFNMLLIMTDYRPDIYTDYTPSADLIQSAAWSTSATDGLGMLSTKFRTERAGAILLIRADKENEVYTFTYFSPETYVYTPAGYQTMGDIYDIYGVDKIAEHIGSLTGTTIDYNIVINGYNLPKIPELLGNVTINLANDIYNDGVNYTTVYETTKDAWGADGKYTEHIPNEYIMGQGENEITTDNIYYLVALRERTQSDISMKESFTIELVSKYLTILSEMDETQRTLVLSELLTLEAEWPNLPNYPTEPEIEEPEISESEEGENPEGEEAETTEGDENSEENSENEEGEEEEEGPVGQEEPYELPENFWDSEQKLWVEYSQYQDTETGLWYMSVRAWDDSVGGWVEYVPIEHTTIEKLFKIKAFKPETPVFESNNFDIDKLKSIDGMLKAYPTLKSITITYPGEVTTGEGQQTYFTPNFKSGISIFIKYRSGEIEN